LSLARTDTKPWYRHFWPWFIIALPATVVVAGISMVFIAFKHADTVVIDDYYREGLAINQRLAQDEAAARLGLAAELRVDLVTGEVLASLDGAHPASDGLRLLLIHPVDADRDQTLTLTPVAGGRYRGELQQAPRGRYYLRLKPAADPLWRLLGEADFSAGNTVRLAPAGGP